MKRYGALMMRYYRPRHKIAGFKFSDNEIRDLFKAWIAISVAFAIVLGREHITSIVFLYNIVLSAFTVGLGFLLHELGHKIVAEKFKLFSEFRSFDKMLVLALVMSFVGFIFVAPGAVMISGVVDRRKNGIISMAGPLVNIVLALVFLALSMFIVTPWAASMMHYGFIINSWLALFNLIPLGVIDGVKILDWNKVVYGLMVIAAFGLMIIDQIIIL